MKADRHKHELGLIADQIVKTVGNGSAATSEARQAIAGIQGSITSLKNSRVYAQQEAEGLRIAIRMLMDFFGDVLSQDISDAITQLQIAEQKVEDYIDYISSQIDQLESLANVVYGNMTNLMSSSGIQVKQASDAIIRFAQNL